jgi:phospholipase/carboxylesterase
MNRLQSIKAPLFPQSGFSATHAFLGHGNGSLTAKSNVAARQRQRASSHYSLFMPLHYEAGYAYPLLVWLHGEGGSERELRQLMPHVSVRNYVGVAARGTASVAGLERGFGWDQSLLAVDEAAERVRESIEAAQERFSVHSERVFIAGNGSGGTMALRLALQFPEWFAGAASLGGPMPSGNNPLGRVKDARGLPLLLASCRDSEDYPQSRVAADLRLLHAAGFSLALRQYPGEHELTTVMLADMDRWIMGLVCPAMAGAAI